MKTLTSNLLLLIAFVMAFTSCNSSNDSIDIYKVESVTIEGKLQPLTIVLDLVLENNLRRNLEIINAEMLALPDKKLRLSLAEPVTIAVGQKNVKVKLHVEGLNLLEIPNLVKGTVINTEIRATLKSGNRKAVEIKRRVPVNINDLIKQAFKNQDYD